ncbi:methylmalonyl-CoA mutase subunit beta [Muriicola sp.]|uniref:methylmalonyl-CoA mutase subunit beta n=1 Tax=Muriicola sp. TaxID=2020856 RepID=UPI003C719CEC
MTKTNKFYDFPGVSAKAWKQQIQAGLQGDDYNARLVWEGPDRIKVKPFYNSEDLEGLAQAQVSAPNSWKIGQVCYVQNDKSANNKALDVLNRGAESLYFVLPNPDLDLNILLKGIDLSKVPVYLELQFVSTAFAKKIAAFKSPRETSFLIHMDVLAGLAKTGNWQQSMEEDLASVFELTKLLPGHRPITIDGAIYQNAGATRVQQLAYMLAQANEYLNHFQNQESSVPFPEPIFKIAVDSDYFFEIAKIRALRMLWKSLAAVYGAPGSCHIIAQPSKRNKTLYEYNANLLRTTTECMAAILGGADTICNLPYDAIYHKDNEFGERIARNQLLILRHESYFGAVSNSADGAYYLETLTRQLAEKALDLFKNLEASGGYLKGLKQHTIQKKIREQAEKEQLQFDNGELVLVGSNVYVNPKDKMKDTIEIFPFLKSNPGKTLIEPILEKRLAESMEQKRLDNE